MNDGKLSFGWVTQPVLYQVPEGSDASTMQAGRDLLAANEQHVEMARQAGFDTIWVEDHMAWERRAHLECFTSMAWLAGRHEGLRYGTMVAGQGYRNPALLARMAVNMHMLTGGRFIMGIGAGNNEGEHRAYGYDFPGAGERLDRMEEAVRVMKALWTESPATFHGKHYSIENAYSSPLPDPPIPLMIGGNGEQKTLRLVAKYADWWCADMQTPDSLRHKMSVLARHCEAEERDMASVVPAQVMWISVEEESAWATRWDNVHIVAGNPDEVTLELEAYREAGARHFMIRFMDYPSPAGMERFVSKVLPRLV